MTDTDTQLAVNLIGPLLLGNLLNHALSGVLGVQVYFYTLTFQKDRVALKSLVYFVLILDLIQTCFSTHAVWNVIIVDWGHITVGSESPIWSIGTASPLAGSVAFIVQTFFAWRIWTLGVRHRAFRFTAVVIVFMALASCILSFFYGITIEKSIFNRALQTGSLSGWLVVCIACDILITVTLVIQLRSKRSNQFRSTNHVLHRAIRMTIETGGLTSLVAIATLALYISTPFTVYYFMLIIISGKMYSNSFLASLNSRAAIFRRSDPSEEVVWFGEEFNLERKITFTAKPTQTE
ncbi:hypothetical protein FPV67DRAFT_583382 [Lyophyllum atratum]|nr:hypothetical protein FPV67DRAFT_583382 [Lyophyllum atratum]